jgi:hypothetical protein
MISGVSAGGGRGPVSREALRGEWEQLAAGIAAEEAGLEPPAGAGGAPAKQPKQPWKRREAGQ